MVSSAMLLLNSSAIGRRFIILSSFLFTWTADCSLDEIDFDELSEMWTKELEFSFETLAAKSTE